MTPIQIGKFAVGLALLVSACLFGHRIGAAGVRAQWQAQQLAERAAAEAARESDRLNSHAAATRYEAQRAAIASRVTLTSPEVRNALHAPICPPAAASAPVLELGDVPIPAAVLQRLRDAGADY